MSMKSRYFLSSRLAQFLRLNGNKVIDGSCKLSLTTSALSLVNSLFLDILCQNDDRRHLLQDVSMEELLTDVQFLHDFIKKTTSLKLFHGMQTLRGGVDLSYFSNLVVLELKKIPTHLIIGLDTLSQQLKALICTRSIYLLKELFGSCSDDENLNVWTELNELNLSYNYLETLDHSLKCLPKLQVLDLSHNSIKQVDEIQVLNKLVVLNLSYNQLDHLPLFNTMSCRSLRKLYIRNNNLEDLEGLDCIFCLEELDVSFNCLSEYHVLHPLEKLKNLKGIKLEGNPLSFHKCHRELAARYFHPSVLNEGIMLDGQLLVSLIKLVPESTPLRNVISIENSGRHQTSINMVVEVVHNTIQMSPDEAAKPFQTSPVIEEKDDDFSKVVSYEKPVKGKSTIKLKGSVPRKKSHKMREALINEPIEETTDADVHVEFNETKLPSHLEAKLDMEAKRRKHGEAWLIPENPFINIQVPKVPCNTPVTNSSHKDQLEEQFTLQSELLNVAEIPYSPLPEVVLATPDISGSKELPSDVQSDDRLEGELEAQHSSEIGDDIEVCIAPTESPIDLDSVVRKLSKENIYDVNVYEKSISQCSSEEFSEDELEGESEDESESQIFIVDRKDIAIAQTLFVNIGPRYIKERHLLTGKVLERLDLTRLSAAEIFTQDKEEKKCEVHIEFDTIKSSNQQRIYAFEDSESAKNMISILQPFADAKILEEVTIGALECLKCNSQFSKEVARRKVIKTKAPLQGQEVQSSSYDSSKGFLQETNICPNCGSNIVIEMETIPIPAMHVPPFQSSTNIPLKNKPIESTQDNVSVGSSSSGSFLSALFSTMKKSPIMTRKTDSPNSDVFTHDVPDSIDSPPINSNVSSTETEPLHPPMRRSSSDITVISNPSQSSIAVISDFGIESELNTIIEKSSQYSLSPPVSEISSMLKPEKNEVFSHNLLLTSIEQDSINGNIHQIPENGHSAATDKEADSHSLNDSFERSQEDFVSDSASYLSQNMISEDSRGPNSNNKEYLDETTELFNLLGQKEIINHDTFTQIDHRLKLHLEISIFDDEEYLNVCVEGTIVPLSTGEEFDGIFVLSSGKVYIIKLLKSSSDDINKSVQIVHSSPLNQLKHMKVIFGDQGFSIACGSRNFVFTVLIRDAELCNSFVTIVTDITSTTLNKRLEILPSTTDQLCQIKEELIEIYHEKSAQEEDPEILFHLFGFWKNSDKEEDELNPICIVVTPLEIFASKVFYKKKESSKNWSKKPLYHYSPVGCQKISDLLSLKLIDDMTAVKLCFCDEENENESLWWISTRTKSSMFSFLNSLRNPWENIFKISLPLKLDDTP